MSGHYRWQKAVLDGSPFGIWLARVLGVKAKIVKVDLTADEVRKLKKDGQLHVSDIQGYLPNGFEE